jgi:hypothetical protein|tara:strand:+ start:322 stop:1224 length:903 start_codon:yes stop_codon:yes gene_type:complete
MHFFWEGMSAATERVAAALISHHSVQPFATVHLQEVFEPAAYAILARQMRSIGLINSSGFSPSGLCSFSILPLEVLFERQSRSLGSARPKAWQALAIGYPEEVCGWQIQVNVHLASEIDGSHASRMEQALQNKMGGIIIQIRSGFELHPVATHISCLYCNDNCLTQASEIGVWVTRSLRSMCRGGRIVQVLVIGDTNEADGPYYAKLARALRAQPLRGLELSYRWLWGIVAARFDRAYLFNQGMIPSAYDDATAAANRGRGEDDDVQGFELTGQVLKELPDISDHFAIRFSTVIKHAKIT